jgi:hypothetical protein
LSARNTQVFFQRSFSFCGPGIKNGLETWRDRQVLVREKMIHEEDKSGVAT